MSESAFWHASTIAGQIERRAGASEAEVPYLAEWSPLANHLIPVTTAHLPGDKPVLNYKLVRQATGE
jgi:hypothetical protein